MICERCTDPNAVQKGDIFNCGACGLRIAKDVVQPTIYVQPDADDRDFIELRLETRDVNGDDTTLHVATHRLDKAHARMVAQNLLSIL